MTLWSDRNAFQFFGGLEIYESASPSRIVRLFLHQVGFLLAFLQLNSNYSILCFVAEDNTSLSLTGMTCLRCFLYEAERIFARFVQLRTLLTGLFLYLGCFGRDFLLVQI